MQSFDRGLYSFKRGLCRASCRGLCRALVEACAELYVEACAELWIEACAELCVEADLLISKQASKTPLCLLDCPIWKPSACLLACWPQNHVCLLACLLITCQDSIELEVL